MKYLFYLIFTVLSCTNAFAETVYVSDDMKLTLRSGESNKHKILKMLSSGTKLELLNNNKDTGYSKVKTSQGLVGYLPTRFIQNKPINSWYLKKANQELELLKSENEQLKASLAEIQQNNNGSNTSDTDLIKERDQLSTDLNNIRQTASNAIQLRQQRNELQERVVNVERELQQLKREKQALEDSTSQDWFLYGGILSFIGIFLGLLIPKISWQRKSHGSWDTL